MHVLVQSHDIFYEKIHQGICNMKEQMQVVNSTQWNCCKEWCIQYIDLPFVLGNAEIARFLQLYKSHHQLHHQVTIACSTRFVCLAFRDCHAGTYPGL